MLSVLDEFTHECLAIRIARKLSSPRGGYATPTGSVGHAGATANPKLKFDVDHLAGAGQRP
jgi:hypothetical protein